MLGFGKSAAVVDDDMGAGDFFGLGRLGRNPHTRLVLGHAARFEEAAQLLLGAACHHPHGVHPFAPARFEQLDRIQNGDIGGLGLGACQCSLLSSVIQARMRARTAG